MTRGASLGGVEPGDPRGPRDAWRTGLLVGAFALVLRLLFLRATPDAGWSYSAWYKGDAPVWVSWADAIQHARSYESGLPVRPPGAAYLIAALAGGDVAGSVVRLKLAWCALGALAVGLVYVAVLRSFGRGLALAVGLLCAASTGLMMLSTSLNNETPYVCLVAASLVLWEPLRRRPGLAVLGAWAGLNAVACLFRVEHALCFAFTLALAMASWIGLERGRGWREVPGRVGVVIGVFTLVLVPWHRGAWSAVHRFNHEPPEVDPATRAAQQQAERALAAIRWQPEASAELERLPAATRTTARSFIGATAWVRGETVVDRDALDILRQAFGWVPEPLPAHPFVSIYGGLNFALANHAGASGGFDRTPLDRPPPLEGGPDRYPAVLVRGLPPAALTLTYPPHLEVVEDGYRLGWDWMRAHPLDCARLAGRKLAIFWDGAALGLGGHDLPLGLDGVRRAVDLAVPGGAAASAWRAAMLALVLAGALLAWRRWELAPWLAFGVSKVIVTVAFFGYARQGATVIPVVVLLVCLGVQALGSRLGGAAVEGAPRARRGGRAVLAAGAMLLAIEAARWLEQPVVELGGRVIGTSDPFATEDDRDLPIRVRAP